MPSVLWSYGPAALTNQPMRLRATLIIITSALLGILQAGFVRVLPSPLDGMMLPIVFVVGLIATFRFQEAFLAAFVSGLMMDVLSSLPPGTETVAMLALTGATIVLFTRIFTNYTLAGTFGINAAAFLMARALYWTIGAVRATFEGISYSTMPSAASAWTLVSSLLVQLVVALVAIGLSAAAARAFSRFFYLRRTRA
jgi:hypothetical protein